MGNSSSSSGHKQLVNQSEPLTFHSTHSEHIAIDATGRVATRVESFCKGICFSARPVAVGEQISIRCSEISTNWSGFLRIGFTAHNPNTLLAQALPRYACPDMTNQPGNWAKALPERFGVVGNVITYYVNRQGDVHIALNGESLPGPFFGGVNISTSLWALIDIYGNATGVEFLDRAFLPSLTFPAPVSLPADPMSSRKQRRSAPTLPSGVSLPPPTSKYYNHFQPLHFHRTTGKCVKLNAERAMALRQLAEYANAYVFSERPIAVQEKIVIQVLEVETSYTGGLTVGVTACDPSSLSSHSFPDDSDQLLDRPEYWVVHKDVVTAAEVGDELSFTLTNAGEIQFSRNNNPPMVIMHVDKTIPLWMFWDLYGQFNHIKLFGVIGAKSKTRSPPVPPPPVPPLPVIASTSPQRTVSLIDSPLPPQAALTVELPSVTSLSLAGAPPIPPRLQRANTVSGAGSHSPQFPDLLGAEAAPALQADSEAADNMANECTICLDKACDSVLYTCGHMCMCFECADAVKAGADPLCPICRQEIKDVIRIYKS